MAVPQGDIMVLLEFQAFLVPVGLEQAQVELDWGLPFVRKLCCSIKVISG